MFAHMHNEQSGMTYTHQMEHFIQSLSFVFLPILPENLTAIILQQIDWKQIYNTVSNCIIIIN